MSIYLKNSLNKDLMFICQKTKVNDYPDRVEVTYGQDDDPPAVGVFIHRSYRYIRIAVQTFRDAGLLSISYFGLKGIPHK